MLPGLEERSRERRERMVGHVAKNFAEAEEWDLDFWQRQTPQDRVSAVASIHRDIELAQRARQEADATERTRHESR